MASALPLSASSLWRRRRAGNERARWGQRQGLGGETPTGWRRQKVSGSDERQRRAPQESHGLLRRPSPQREEPAADPGVLRRCAPRRPGSTSENEEKNMQNHEFSLGTNGVGAGPS